MKIQIKATNLELTPAIRAFVEEKMNMVDKYFGEITPTMCQFEVDLVSHHHHKGDIFRAEVNLEVPGELLRVEKTEGDLYKAIDKVKEHLVEVVKKYKEKKIGRQRE